MSKFYLTCEKEVYRTQPARDSDICQKTKMDRLLWLKSRTLSIAKRHPTSITISATNRE
jgi:hypothetical protein